MNFSLLFLLAAVIGFSGCGRSPLLHHGDESRPVTKTARVMEHCDGHLQWNEDLCAEVQWLDGPLVGDNNLAVVFSSDIRGKSFSFSATMPSMQNHGTPPFDVSQVNASRYDVKGLYLMMPGRWVLHVLIDGVERSVEVNL